MQTAMSSQGGGLLPRISTTQDLASLLSEIGSNPAFEREQARGTITEQAYIMRASVACTSMTQGKQLVDTLEERGWRVTLNGAYSPSGAFTPWNELAKLFN